MSATDVAISTAETVGDASVIAGAGKFIASKAGWKLGLGIAGRIAFKAIPIIGWASLAYDGYQLANYAWENKDAIAAKVEMLLPEQQEERQLIAQVNGDDVSYATMAAGATGTTLLAGTAMAVMPANANGASANGSNGGKPPRGGRLRRAGKVGLALAAWEGAAYLADKLFEDDLDRQYEAAENFEREIVGGLEAGRAVPLSAVDHRIIQTLSMEYGKALSAYDGEQDMSEAQFKQVWDQTKQAAVSQMGMLNGQEADVTLTNQDFANIAKFTEQQLREGLQPDQHAPFMRQVQNFSPFN